VDLDPTLHPRPLAVVTGGLDDPGGAVDVQADALLIEEEWVI
jgi:hypothetical protein